MKLIRLLYLLSFFAPIAFLLGYMAGAPRAVAPSYKVEHIDNRVLPATAIDFYRNEASLVVADDQWLQPNPPAQPR
jgi:hypothetical protein